MMQWCGRNQWVGAMTAVTSILAASGDARAQTRRLGFDPTTQGFNFANTFNNVVNLPAGVNVRTAGLCGGMAYAALDFWLAHQTPPRQNYTPAEGTPLQRYLYDRQYTSIVSNVDKWAEISVNPFGARDSEFFNWGLQGSNGGRIEELRSFIDRGMPVPLGLKADKGGDHQVLAVGYDMGGYRGDLGANAANFRIFVYDSNHPNKTMTLAPDMAGKVYRYVGETEGDPNRWRTYFVDKNYHAVKPASFATAAYPNDGLVHELLLSFATGEDDLRGGNDNIDLTVDVFDGTQQHFSAVNGRSRWISNYTQTVQVVLQRPVPPAQIRRLVLTDTFGGGVDGDNWDMKELDVSFVGATATPIKTVGFHRFTGSDKVFAIPIHDAPPVVAGQVSQMTFEIRTGGDDLRGGNDNLNISVLFADGRTQVESNANNSERWADNTTHKLNIVLNKPVPVAEIKSVTLSTTFGGGMGGDNWNMDWAKVTATGSGVSRVVANAAAKRFTGSDKQLVVPVR